MIALVEAARRASRVLLPKGIYLRCASRYGAAVSVLRLGSAVPRQLRSAATALSALGELVLHPPGLVHPVVVRYGATDAIVFANN